MVRRDGEPFFLSIYYTLEMRSLISLQIVTLL